DSIDHSLETIESEDKLEEVHVEKPASGEKNINWSLLKEVEKVILELAARLESAEKNKEIKKKFQELLKEDKFGDIELVIEDLFHNVGGLQYSVLTSMFDN